MQTTDSYKAVGLATMVMIDFWFSRLFRVTPTCVSAVILISKSGFPDIPNPPPGAAVTE